jgi:hypothetical protein
MKSSKFKIRINISDSDVARGPMRSRLTTYQIYHNHNLSQSKSRQVEENKRSKGRI